MRSNVGRRHRTPGCRRRRISGWSGRARGSCAAHRRGLPRSRSMASTSASAKRCAVSMACCPVPQPAISTAIGDRPKRPVIGEFRLQIGVERHWCPGRAGADPARIGVLLVLLLHRARHVVLERGEARECAAQLLAPCAARRSAGRGVPQPAPAKWGRRCARHRARRAARRREARRADDRQPRRRSIAAGRPRPAPAPRRAGRRAPRRAWRSSSLAPETYSLTKHCRATAHSTARPSGDSSRSAAAISNSARRSATMTRSRSASHSGSTSRSRQNTRSCARSASAAGAINSSSDSGAAGRRGQAFERRLHRRIDPHEADRGND